MVKFLNSLAHDSLDGPLFLRKQLKNREISERDGTTATTPSHTNHTGSSLVRSRRTQSWLWRIESFAEKIDIATRKVFHSARARGDNGHALQS
mgnify:CR=1 FL=1